MAKTVMSALKWHRCRVALRVYSIHSSIDILSFSLSVVVFGARARCITSLPKTKPRNTFPRTPFFLPENMAKNPAFSLNILAIWLQAISSMKLHVRCTPCGADDLGKDSQGVCDTVGACSLCHTISSLFSTEDDLVVQSKTSKTYALVSFSRAL